MLEVLGSFPGEHKIQLKSEVNPVIQPPQKSRNYSPRQTRKRVGENGEFESYFKGHGTHHWMNSIATSEKQRTGALRVW